MLNWPAKGGANDACGYEGRGSGTPLILALKAEEGGARLRKEGQEFKANQGYMRPCPQNTRILPDVTTRCQPRTLHKLVALATEF